MLAISLRRAELYFPCLRRKPDALVVVESWPLRSQQLPEHPDFLLQILNDGLLLALEPANKAEEDELQGIHGRNLPGMASEGNPESSDSQPMSR